jgi:hypothetical protein
MMDISDVRKQVQHTLEAARRDAASHRGSRDAAQQALPGFLATVAAPVFRQVATVLKSEGFAFSVFTPADSVRLASDRNADDYIEMVLDADRDPVALVFRRSVVRGRRILEDEQALRPGTPLAELADQDVLDALLRLLPPFVAR